MLFFSSQKHGMHWFRSLGRFAQLPEPLLNGSGFQVSTQGVLDAHAYVLGQAQHVAANTKQQNSNILAEVWPQQQSLHLHIGIPAALLIQ